MRTGVLDSLEDTNFDLIVVGAGINGAGIARDAAMRGLSVLLVDRGDVSSGTTAWSTRLIHGGLRYLEYGEVPLVRESLKERETLLHVAEHLVRPLHMLVPIYEGDRRGPRVIRLGLLAYDALSLDSSMDRHHMLDREAVIGREPGLSREGLKGAALYYDAQVEFAERLALENALDAREQGAVLLTYASVERFMVESNVVRGVEILDVLGGRRLSARGEVVINVTGPWVDRVLLGQDRPAERLIGGTKGSHLVVEPFPGAPDEALYVEAAKDGRPFFIVPWNGLFLIGTTDRRYEDDLDRVVAEDDEVAYLIEETNRVVPGAGLTPDGVLYTYAGVRPLPFVPEGKEGGVTRRHIIRDHTPELAAGLLSVVGGKITTYRNLSEQAVDAVFGKLGRRSPKCRTAEVPLPGGATGPLEGYASTFRRTSGLDAATAERLVRLYGTRADEVLGVAEGAPDLRAPVAGEPGTLGAEVVYAFAHEEAQTLTDVLMRRTMIGLGRTAGVGPDRAAAEICVHHLGWDEDRAAREVDAFREYVTRYRPRSLVAT